MKPLQDPEWVREPRVDCQHLRGPVRPGSRRLEDAGLGPVAPARDAPSQPTRAGARLRSRPGEGCPEESEAEARRGLSSLASGSVDSSAGGRRARHGCGTSRDGGGGRGGEGGRGGGVAGGGGFPVCVRGGPRGGGCGGRPRGAPASGIYGADPLRAGPFAYRCAQECPTPICSAPPARPVSTSPSALYTPSPRFTLRTVPSLP